MKVLKEYYNLVDKSNWPRGEWDEEPDIINLEYKEFYCMIMRHPRFGNLNGYVALYLGHKNHGKDYDDIDVNVHGGLTMACFPEDELGEIYPNVMYEYHRGKVWWIGFDTAHYMDYSPGLFNHAGLSVGTYRSIKYLKKELTDLCKQLKE